MALHLTQKAAGDTVRYGWTPPIVAGDSLESATLSVTAGAATLGAYSIEGDTVFFFLSGGTAGETTVLAASVVTGEDETLTETIYIPIRTRANLYTNTARDVCNFAMRKITGTDEAPTAGELDVALEILNDMLALWRIDGPDIGIAKELVASDTLTIPESFLAAVKYNLAVLLAEEFDRPLTATLDRAARESKQAASTALLGMADLTFERTLTRPKPMTSINDI